LYRVVARRKLKSGVIDGITANHPNRLSQKRFVRFLTSAGFRRVGTLADLYDRLPKRKHRRSLFDCLDFGKRSELWGHSLLQSSQSTFTLCSYGIPTPFNVELVTTALNVCALPSLAQWIVGCLENLHLHASLFCANTR
jgi:hypothetical protein